MADAPLPLDALIAWGREWQRQLEAGPVVEFSVPRPLLDHYVATANEALALMAERPAGTKRPGGRPKDSGMGAEAAWLIANRLPKADAVRMVAEHHGTAVENVRDVLRHYLRGKNPP